MSRIYCDSTVFAYWLEDHPVYAGRVATLLDRIVERGDTLCTSSFTLGEILAAPYRVGAETVAGQIADALNGSIAQLLPFDSRMAQVFAKIRAKHQVSMMDAIHLATAAGTQTNLFITNDENLRNVARTISGIDFVASLESGLF